MIRGLRMERAGLGGGEQQEGEGEKVMKAARDISAAWGGCLSAERVQEWAG